MFCIWCLRYPANELTKNMLCAKSPVGEQIQDACQVFVFISTGLKKPSRATLGDRWLPGLEQDTVWLVFLLKTLLLVNPQLNWFVFWISFVKLGLDSGLTVSCLTVKHCSSYFQVGIVSWGYGCGDKDYPGHWSNTWMLMWNRLKRRVSGIAVESWSDLESAELIKMRVARGGAGKGGNGGEGWKSAERGEKAWI